eukprot:18306-Eustigmatos_ZCMA.PRE.1
MSRGLQGHGGNMRRHYRLRISPSPAEGSCRGSGWDGALAGQGAALRGTRHENKPSGAVEEAVVVS